MENDGGIWQNLMTEFDGIWGYNLMEYNGWIWGNMMVEFNWMWWWSLMEIDRIWWNLTEFGRMLDWFGGKIKISLNLSLFLYLSLSLFLSLESYINQEEIIFILQVSQTTTDFPPPCLALPPLFPRYLLLVTLWYMSW